MANDKKCLLPVIALAALVSCALGQSADEIIAKYIQARGGAEKLKSVQSMKTTATMTMGPGMEFTGTVIKKRPAMARLEFTVQGLTAVQAYDGKEAWQIMPFMGKKDPELMAADETKQTEEMADVDGPLVDYKSKGHQLELLGKAKVEGSDAYKLKLTLKNGDVQTVYLDAKSFLQIREVDKRTIRGTEQETESSIGDYKEVDGMMFPFAIENAVKGSDQQQMITINKIELNLPVDDSIFKMPAARKPDAPKADTPKADQSKN